MPRDRSHKLAIILTGRAGSPGAARTGQPNAFSEGGNADPPQEGVGLAQLEETTTRMLGSLTPREEEVLRMRFGIGMESEYTLAEIGQKLSVTRERVRQIEAKALRKLKQPTRAHHLHSVEDQ